MFLLVLGPSGLEMVMNQLNTFICFVPKITFVNKSIKVKLAHSLTVKNIQIRQLCSIREIQKILLLTTGLSAQKHYYSTTSQRKNSLPQSSWCGVALRCGSLSAPSWTLRLKLVEETEKLHFISTVSGAEIDRIGMRLCSSITLFQIWSFSPQRLSNNKDKWT